MAVPDSPMAGRPDAIPRNPGSTPPGIESTPGVCGGSACIARTRIPVWLLEQCRRLGFSQADLLADYPTLRAEDLDNAWNYIRDHGDEIQREIRRNEEV